MEMELEKGCVTTAMDRAFVNFGVKSGALTLLQEDMPWMLKIHCVAHRLELAIAETFKSTYFKDVVRTCFVNLGQVQVFVGGSSYFTKNHTCICGGRGSKVK